MSENTLLQSAPPLCRTFAPKYIGADYYAACLWYKSHPKCNAFMKIYSIQKRPRKTVLAKTQLSHVQNASHDQGAG